MIYSVMSSKSARAKNDQPDLINGKGSPYNTIENDRKKTALPFSDTSMNWGAIVNIDKCKDIQAGGKGDLNTLVEGSDDSDIGEIEVKQLNELGNTINGSVKLDST